MEPHFPGLGAFGAFLMGITLGVFGAGGSILTVPILVYLFLFPPVLAAHCSLMVVGLVSAFGVGWQWSGGSLDLKKMAGFALPAMLGMFSIKKLILPHLPAELVTPWLRLTLDQLTIGLFAILMIAAALSMIFVQIREEPPQGEKKKNLFLLSGAGLSIGLVTGFVGAGGGFLIVPSLVFLAGFPVKEATRASLFLIALNSLWGFVNGTRDWAAIPFSLLLLIVSLAVAGIILGLRLQKRLPAARLKPAFGVFVLGMGLYVLLRSSS